MLHIHSYDTRTYFHRRDIKTGRQRKTKRENQRYGNVFLYSVHKSWATLFYIIWPLYFLLQCVVLHLYVCTKTDLITYADIWWQFKSKATTIEKYLSLCTFYHPCKFYIGILVEHKVCLNECHSKVEANTNGRCC